MHTIIWRYIIKPDSEADFECAYGPDGDWAVFFRKGAGYLGTDLCRSSEPGAYLTIDRWRSREDYEHFAHEHAKEYAAIDARCDALTIGEEKLFQGDGVG